MVTELSQPGIPHYDPRYSFERTAHVRLARLGFIGTPIQKTLDSLIPGWDNSVTITLILERESLAAMVVAIALFLSLLRFSLRWYGEKHLLTCSMRMRHRLRDAYQAFLNTATAPAGRGGLGPPVCPRHARQPTKFRPPSKAK